MAARKNPEAAAKPARAPRKVRADRVAAEAAGGAGIVKEAAEAQAAEDAAAKEAERIVAIDAARKGVHAKAELLETMLAAGEAVGVIAAADELLAAVKQARRAVSTSTRKRPDVVRPRHTPGKGLWVLVDAAGIAKEADFRPSLARDRSQAKKLQRNERDMRLAACELITRADYEARELVPA